MKIELSNICKYFEIPDTNIKREVLNNIDLEINPGDSIAITGPSGSGKSTLLNIIGTLDQANSGKVLYGGENIIGFSEKKLAEFRNSSLGFIFQLHHLLPQLNLLENVMIPTLVQKNIDQKVVKERAMELLESVGLSDKITQRPGQLSVGECQRTAVVRALINKPELILADEPTGSLDKENAGQMGDLLSKISAEQGISLVTVTHSDILANKMKTIYSLEDGGLIKH